MKDKLNIIIKYIMNILLDITNISKSFISNSFIENYNGRIKRLLGKKRLIQWLINKFQLLLFCIIFYIPNLGRIFLCNRKFKIFLKIIIILKIISN